MRNCILTIAAFTLVIILASGCKKDDSSDDPTYTIGQSTEGGIVFYVYDEGKHALIAATSDQSTNCIWGCAGTQISVAQDSTIGCGMNNTNAIVSGCSATNTAAKICSNLSLGGYSDWFLPSKLELALMYAQKATIGGFTNFGYWSSTQHGDGNAWVQYFNDGTKMTAYKGDAYRVRAIRSI